MGSTLKGKNLLPGSTLKEKNLLPLFPFRVDPSEGDW